jgi:general secretion pathway protein D
MKAIVVILACVMTGSWATPLDAQESQGTAAQPAAALQRIELADLIESMSGKAGRTFLIDHRVEPTVVVGQLDTTRIDYGMFLHILRNNGLAAVNADRIVSIIPVGIVRQYALPVIEAGDDDIHDEEWVTWMYFLDNADAVSIVPILRPMMPAEGHLAANQATNGIIVVDRYGNAKRIVGLAQELDEGTPSR